MLDVTPDHATEAAVMAFDNTPDDRLREVLSAAARHLHAFVREVQPSMQEWEFAIDFLTRIGHMCDDQRQEFILFSDVMGVTNLVEQLESARIATGTTATTVLGPFHMTVSPDRALGDQISLDGTGTPCYVEGVVSDTEGAPLAGAHVDVWQANGEGFYDVQLVGDVPEGTGRGLFTTDEDGRFWFRTVTPAPYPIPTDGPVGELLTATKRSEYRPAHLHFQVSKDGYHTLTTHAFVAGSDWIDSDAVFATKGALVVDFPQVTDAAEADSLGLSIPCQRARFDVKISRRDA